MSNTQTKSTLTPTTQSSLDKLAEQFKQWRSSRASYQTPIPKHLRERAIYLQKDHLKSHIIKAIGINSTIFKAWQAHQSMPSDNNTFVPVNVETLPKVTDTSKLEVTFSCSKSTSITIKGSLSPAQLTAICLGLSPLIQPLEKLL